MKISRSWYFQISDYLRVHQPLIIVHHVPRLGIGGKDINLDQ